MSQNKYLLIISVLLKIESVMGTMAASIFSITMAAFATDSPYSSKIVATAIGIAFFVLLFSILGCVPWWSSNKIRTGNKPGFIAAILYSGLICFIYFPLGTILGAYQAVSLIGLYRR